MEENPPHETGPPHILVVDDDTRLRKLLQKFLMEHGYRVTLAASAAEARGRMEGLAFDLTILDVMMPGEGGLTLTQFLRSRSEMPVLLLSARSETDARIAGLEAGADDYLGKPFEPKELLLRMRALLRRATPGPDATQRIIRLAGWEANLDRGDLRKGDLLVRLAPGELGLLRLLAANPGVPVSRSQLSEQTGAAQERTVDVQITRLRRKFEPDPRAPRHLQTVRGQGYVLWPD
ncbi:MAG: two-component system, OmpR family, phosphate regulon response regulator OmpR [Alphaproteobacteria bacterium]|nr:two-component system, OmpR family, phosphate regulon response regulator OmpR [Alphaproteobacteria bacterium]